jgi:hypothetical protein
MTLSCFNLNLHRAVGVLIQNEDTVFVKRIIIRILRHYAKSTATAIDDELVDEIQRRLTPL